MLRIDPGFDFSRTFSFLSQKRCGVPGDTDYAPRLLVNLLGSTISARLWWPGGELIISPLVLSSDTDDLGISVLSRVTLPLTQVQSGALPQGYDFWLEFRRNIGGNLSRLGRIIPVRVETESV